ncbi:hypothetical protein Srot_2397 [Segniliparus rotundus DSM 44985]|uniref:Uncharacterized protein n=1 Tax=Segniliparus rotundus (strain ATCC BAA-972 / CDC 1076 / CIP 108378 / DSM 44985 / JCM 13578) TaxID=640132 RepID=D6ZAV5_SEGRD|nr:hypothetical protein [Segniliparus rotundus]ADG98841.1 hypothetical protein Srot_2397 [Segniliparus rotundus DSM 44985]
MGGDSQTATGVVKVTDHGVSAITGALDALSVAVDGLAQGANTLVEWSSTPACGSSSDGRAVDGAIKNMLENSPQSWVMTLGGLASAVDALKDIAHKGFRDLTEQDYDNVASIIHAYEEYKP